MIRFLILLAVLFAVALGFTWLKGTSGEVALTLGDTAYAVDLTTAVVALALAILFGMAMIWLVRAILSAPWRLARGWRERNRARGRASLSQGLLAIAAGDLRSAERAMVDASRRVPEQPLTRLLKAQTEQLRGNRVAARGIFQEMTEDPETRIAGLRGLYIEAEREGEHLAARQIAERARREAPTAPWAARALLRHQTAAADWDGALATLTGGVDGRIIDRRSARRQRAVILTAKALAKEDGEPDAARQAATEAHDLANDLVPAAVVAGRLLARQGDMRRATRILETTWKTGPHPEIADAHLHVRAGDAAGDRLKRAETLFRMRPQADEGRHAVARAAIDARDFARAREMLTPLVMERPTQKAFFLMAELEEAESGDSGRARGWIARAAYAPRDPVWTADGVVLEEWAPVSPATGALDAVEWKVPVAELEGPRIEIEAEALAPPEPAPADAAADTDGPSGREDAGDRRGEDRKGERGGSTQDRAPPRDAVTPTPGGPKAAATVATVASADQVGGGKPASHGEGTAQAEAGVTAEIADAPPAADGADMDAAGPVVAEPPRPDDPGVAEEPEDDSAPALPSFLTGDDAATRRRA